MPKHSAGLLGYRHGPDGLEFLLVHPGGPFWVRKDDGAWSLPKGEFEPGEEPLEAAKREYTEETGFSAEGGSFVALGTLRQPSGKEVSAWAFQTDADVATLRSNDFELEWPPRSGRRATFPEVDRAGWFSAEAARRKLVRGQVDFIDAALEALGAAGERLRGSER